MLAKVAVGMKVYPAPTVAIVAPVPLIIGNGVGLTMMAKGVNVADPVSFVAVTTILS